MGTDQLQTGLALAQSFTQSYIEEIQVGDRKGGYYQKKRGKIPFFLKFPL